MMVFSFFFFNDTATTEIYTLSLHDALPIFMTGIILCGRTGAAFAAQLGTMKVNQEIEANAARSEEHTSELQSPDHLVCRLLLEKKNNSVVTVNVCPTTIYSMLVGPSDAHSL